MRARRCAFAVLLVATVVGSAPADAEDGPSFGTFALSASAAGVDATEDRPDAVAHPEGQAALPWTSASLSAGPVAYGLSTIAWPGAIAGNAGKLANVALPSAAGGVPIPDAVRQVVLDNASAADYPIRAEARNGSTPDATYGVPGTTLKAHADDATVTADAAVEGADQADVATYGNMTARTALKLAATAVAEASSLVHDISLAGGAVKIGSVRSSAKATTDGATATADGLTTVSSLEVAGQKAFVDSNGVHSGEPGQPLNPVTEQLLGQAMDGFGIDVYLSAPRKEVDAAKASFDAGSLIVVWHPPSEQAPTFVWSLGGARVSVDAQPGFDVGLPAVDDLAGGAPLDPGVLGDVGPVAPSSVDVAPVAAPPAAAPAAPGTGGGATTLPFEPVAAVFEGNPASWLLAAFALAAILGALAKRVALDLIDGPATSCPLDPGAHP